MLRKLLFAILPAIACMVLAPPARSAGLDDQDAAKLEKQRCPKPKALASVFSFGYGGDDMPRDDARFEELLVKVKEGGFNVIHCTYTDKRLELCKKHGVQMMVHLLHEETHHVYKSPDKAKAVCEKLRGNPDVWGYNVWNDTFAKSVEGRKRDINSVRTWDPTHPAFSGTYRSIGMSRLTNPDVFGYYDFHWKRGVGQHFPRLLEYAKWAQERDAWFYSWFSVTSGLPGKGNFNRNLWSANTGIACGLKGILWFLATDMMNGKSLTWTAHGQDIIKVNAEIMPLKLEIAKLGNPIAIYSTPITTCNNEPLPGGKTEMMPPGLEGRAFPKDFWIQPAGGEFLMGVFQDDQKRGAVFLANHNAYAEQKVTLKATRSVKASQFNRKDGTWQPLEVKDGTLTLPLAPGGGELLRFER